MIAAKMREAKNYRRNELKRALMEGQPENRDVQKLDSLINDMLNDNMEIDSHISSKDL
jgi:hypothetical protein